MCDGELLSRFEPTTRDTDVFCVTAAKCGQTWLLATLHHLRTRGRDPNYGGVGLGGVTPWLELPKSFARDEPFDRDARLATFDALEDPRVFKMHVLWEEIPRPPGSRSKVITITRDPRDLPWSMYSHLRGMRPEIRAASVEDGFDAYFESWMEFGYFFKFVQSFWPHRDDPDLLWLRFEDLKRDLRAEAEKIVAWAGWDLAPTDIDRALQWVDFAHMQAQERTSLMTEARNIWQDDARFFREGAVGANRARLSPDQEARIVSRARETFEPACLEWVMSQGL